jgi:large subunit ribosomal protein L17
MRHLVADRKLNRTTEHRRAMLRNLAQNLFEHGQVTTTLPKAKAARPFCERLITLAKRAKAGELAARRRIVQLLGDRAVIDSDHQEEYERMSLVKRRKVLRSRSGRRHRLGRASGGLKFTAESIVRRLVENVAPMFTDRNGGYTRIVRLGTGRPGDNSPRAVLQLVGREESPGSVTRPEKVARRKRADARYKAAAKAVSGEGKKAQKPAATPKAEPEAGSSEAPASEG